MIVPRLPRLLDTEDWHIVATIVICSVLAIWIVLTMALALGLAVRLFEAVAWA